MKHSLRPSVLAMLIAVISSCSAAEERPADSNAPEGSGGASLAPGSGGAVPAGAGGSALSPSGGAPSAAGGTATGAGGTVTESGGAPAGTGTGGTEPEPLPDAGAGGSGSGGSSPVADGMTVGVNVHNYPKPTAYGYVAADGKDRMGDALVQTGITVARAGTIGDTTFLNRLHDFGVKEVILLLSASAHGKPFDPSTVLPALQRSLAVTDALGLTVQVEGLNEWDLFNSRPYNAGVLPAGMSNAEFVLFTQRALYEAAHSLGLTVLGPSVGHPHDPAALAFFPDVSAYVDVVNAHSYFGTNPESTPLAARVRDHERFQGAGKPFWVTETGVSSYGGVTPEAQADIIRRGLTFFDASGLVDRLFIYELLENREPGWDGLTYTPDSGEYHFGLFTYEGAPKPAAAVVHDFIAGP